MAWLVDMGVLKAAKYEKVRRRWRKGDLEVGWMADCGGDVVTTRTKAGLGFRRLAVCCGGEHSLPIDCLE